MEQNYGNSEINQRTKVQGELCNFNKILNDNKWLALYRRRGNMLF